MKTKSTLPLSLQRRTDKFVVFVYFLVFMLFLAQIAIIVWADILG